MAKKRGRPRDPESLRSRGVSRYQGERTVIYLPWEMRQALEDRKLRDGLPVAEQIRQAVAEWLERHSASG